MWGAWDRKHVFILGLALFLRFVFPVVAGAALLTWLAVWFISKLFGGGIHP